jgi:hypothetical protein
MKPKTNYRWRCLLLLAIFVTTWMEVSVAQKPESSVPVGFSYPDTPQSIEFVQPFLTKSLSGRVQLHALRSGSVDMPVQKAIVERMSADWSTRLEATFSNSKGDFSFSGSLKGTNYLRVSKPGYATLKLKVIVTKRAPAKLDLPMAVCCVMS